MDVHEVEGVQRGARVGGEKPGAEVVVRVPDHLPAHGTNSSVGPAGGNNGVDDAESPHTVRV